MEGFNPSVGILFIQAARGNAAVGPNPAVSIPRSGFCSFKRWSVATDRKAPSRFNPSVGILFIQAAFVPPGSIWRLMFQSLGRDSVHSSLKRRQARKAR